MKGRPNLWVDRDREADAGPFSSARWNRQAEAARLRRSPAEEPPDETPPEPRRRLRAVLVPAGALAVALVALALAAFSLLNDDGDSGALPLADAGGVPKSAAGRVYQAAGPGVVSVRAGSASGTGFVVRADGTIVTNAHVVGTEDTATVRFNDTGREVEADVLGSDTSSDLAVLRVDPGSVDNLSPLRLTDSKRVAVGDPVVAIGHPFDLDRTVTAGIVSGVGRQIQAPDGFQIDEVIQTDAAINPGNSGGPLLDSRGRVIGVNTQIATAGNPGNVGIGFAVPSNTVRDVVPRLARGQTIRRPFLGVTTTPDPRGASVVGVSPGGPAQRDGVRGGDVITGIDGSPVSDPDDVSTAIAGLEPGDDVEVELLRDGERRTLTVTLDTRPRRTP